MNDLIYTAALVVLFAVTGLYAVWCGKL